MGGGGVHGGWFLPMAYLDSPACHTLVISVNACLTHDKNIRALAVADHRWIIAMLKMIERCTGQSIIVRGPGTEPGKWVQSFFLDVFMLYGYCTL